MMTVQFPELETHVQNHRAKALAALRETFLRHSADNRGALASGRRAKQVTQVLFDLAHEYAAGRADVVAVAREATRLASQGMALTTAAGLLATLHHSLLQPNGKGAVPVDMAIRLSEFQAHFLQEVAGARERQYLQTQESSQQATYALLQLSASLSSSPDEPTLLANAAHGLRHALGLELTQIVEWLPSKEEWLTRASSGARESTHLELSADVRRLLEAAWANAGESTHEYPGEDGQPHLIQATVFTAAGLRGGLVAEPAEAQSEKAAELAVLIRGFGQSLAGLWRNSRLLAETRQRAREFELLQGEYLANVWQAGGSELNALYHNGRLEVRQPAGAEGDGGNLALLTTGTEIPVVLGETALGNVTLPAGAKLDREDADFVQALVREMGNALNNAYLLQATRSYSNQLRVAADVSRAATTILDRDVLMKEVVELIRQRFDLYYVGLFLVDEKDEAVLRAGTGDAGRIQVERGHKLRVGGSSMIGQAIARGEARVEQNVAQARDWQPNPLLPETRSELALPLTTRGRTIGALTVQSQRPAAFSEESIVVLTTLADQLATAIENASLFVQIQGTLAETNRLYRAGRLLSEAATAVEVYQILVEFARDSGLVDLVHIIAPDPTSPDHLVSPTVWSRHEIPGAGAVMQFSREKFPFSRVLSENRLIIIQDGQSDEGLDPATRRLFKHNGVRGAALIPIHMESQWLATLALDRVAAEPPTQQELQPFLTLCDQAAVILANQQLLNETNALYRISRALNQAISQEEALQITVDEVGRHLLVDQCRVVLYDRDAGQGHVAAASGRPAWVGTRLPMSGDPTFDSLAISRQPVLLVDHGRADTPESVQLHLRQFGAHWSLLFPAVSQQELVGYLALDSWHAERELSPGQMNFARSITDQLTTTVESIKLYDEALRRAQELILLNQIGTRISGTLDLVELAQVIREQLALLLAHDSYTLALYEGRDRTYRVLLQTDGESIVEVEPRTLSAGDALDTFLQRGEALLADRVATQRLGGWDSAQGLGGQPPQSSLWVPLQQEGQPAGLIALQSRRSRAYRENDLQLLRSIATQASLAISNARLFQETQDNVAELRLLFTITQAAASSIDASERMDNMVEALHNSLGGADVYLLVGSESEGQLETIAARTRGRQRAGASRRSGLVGQAISLGQPLLVNDLRELAEDRPDGTQIGSQLVVPLNMGRRTVGVINAESPQANAFTERDLRLLQTLSVSLAATLESGRLFREIQSANEQLRELDRLKTQFLANMSHELRTPLNSIIGFSRVILKGIDGPITPQQEEDLTSINNSGHHLLRLINDILDLAKIEAGKIAMAFETVDLQETAESVLSTARGLVKDRPIRLEWDIQPNLPLIEADPIRLRQILINFLSNAAKFTEKGFIRLRIRREGPAKVHISVTDSGIGIAPEHADKIFTAFEQVDSSATRSVGGTGLGLPITRRLVEMHNGEIWFESEASAGTTFHVVLPIQQEGEPPAWDEDMVVAPAAFEPETGDGYDPAILIIEDEPGVVNLYERYLRNQPYRLIRVGDGHEGLREIERYGEAIKLVLLDINLPGVDGWHVLQKIRENPATAKLPVVVCSIESDFQKAGALGAQLLLPKPIIEDDLLSALNRVQAAS
jgi:signal transduction histidine kinase